MKEKRLSFREYRDMKVQEAVARAMSGQITWKEAELIVGCTPRHMRRLRGKCVLEGLESLRDKRAGRPMPKQIKTEVVQEILHLRQIKYFDFNVKHFHEMLRLHHHIAVSYSYLKRLLQTTGLAEKAKSRGKHRRQRPRRPMRGMMLQMDGSSHAWLGPEHGERTLITLVDDATSEVLYGQFFVSESTHSCLTAIFEVLFKHGLFSELYVDRASHFVWTRQASDGPQRGHTQIERVVRDLRIQLIFAYSPQAKGRIERSFRTQQGRIPQELRAAGISSWDAANRSLNKSFWRRYNQQFKVPPQNDQDGFIPLVGVDIRRACALEYTVSVRPDNCVQWNKQTWQIPPHPSRPSFARCKATLVEYLDGQIDIEYGRFTIATFNKKGKRRKAKAMS